MDYIKKIRIFISLMPIIWITSFFIFVIMVSIKIGEMPRYNLPDPKGIGIGFEAFHFVLFIAIPPTLLAIITYPIFLYFTYKGHKMEVFEILLYGAGILLFFTQIFIDPFQLQDWFGD